MTVAILFIPILMTPTRPALGSAALCLGNDFAQLFRYVQELSVPMLVAGKGEQIFSRRSVRGAERIWMNRPILCYLENFAFVAITGEWNGLSESKAVRPLKYLCTTPS